MLSATFLLVSATLLVSGASAQIALSTAVDLAVSRSPRVKVAQAELDRALGGLAEAKDVYIPVVSVGGGLGYPFGFSAGVPSIFNVTATSLVYNFSQRTYIRSAHANVDAAGFSLRDAQESTAADATLSFVALAYDERRDRTRAEQAKLAQHLVAVVEDRVSLGRDPAIDLTGARLTVAQIRLAGMHDADQTAADRAHLARLLGMPPAALTLSADPLPPTAAAGAIPAASSATAAAPSVIATAPPDAETLSPSVRSAYANAQAKQLQATADTRYVLRPQIGLGVQYQQYASYQNQAIYYPRGLYSPYLADLGVQLTLPIFDRGHRDKEHQSAAAARSARSAADLERDQVAEAGEKLRGSIPELRLRLEIATLEQQMSEQQLETVLIEESAPPAGSTPPVTPRDEANARLAERTKELAVLDARFQLQQAEINLLRQDGRLVEWLRQTGSTPAFGPHP